MRFKYRRLVPWGWATLALITYLATYLGELLCMRFGVDSKEIVDPIFPVRLLFLCIWAGLYAIHRVFRFHPIFNKGYLQWLVVSPWDISKPFPLGPPHIVWVDFIVIGILTALAHLNGWFSPLFPAIAFLAVHIVLSAWAIGLVLDYLWYSVLALVLAPFAIYPHRDPQLAFVVLVCLNAWLYIGYRQEFRGFPWNTEYWKSNPVHVLRKGFAKKELIGRLQQMLKLYNPDPELRMTFFGALLIAGFITWWLHVLLWVIGEPTNHAAGPYIIGGTLILIIVRTAVYKNPGYRAPISFWGRLFTFNWIIPRYDIVYVAPLCMIAAFAAMLTLGGFIPLGETHLFELLVFVEFLLTLSLPPKLVSWRLIGAHRMVEAPKRGRGQLKATVPLAEKAAKGIFG